FWSFLYVGIRRALHVPWADRAGHLGLFRGRCLPRHKVALGSTGARWANRAAWLARAPGTRVCACLSLPRARKARRAAPGSTTPGLTECALRRSRYCARRESEHLRLQPRNFTQPHEVGAARRAFRPGTNGCGLDASITREHVHRSLAL